MPVFALANAGISFDSSLTIDYSLAINIALSLFVGKFIGVALFSFIGIKMKWAELPSGINFRQILGAALLAGLGFTMALFIGNLAFAGQEEYLTSAKIGIIAGSLLSGISAYLFFVWPVKSKK
jgi:Na+:H+ antiporter, NhaA family